MRIGTALHCRIEPSIFHRKNYFYPDMPKDYQISQYDLPINVDGWLELPGGRRIGIVRAHMEEDTGKTTHVGGGGRIHEAAHSLVDYNRAGVPLVEIVSAPDLRGADEARTYVDELRAILVATGASPTARWRRVRCGSTPTCPSGPAAPTEFGTRCEIKNLNSLRSLGRAIDYEAARQIDVIRGGGAGRPGDPALGRGVGPNRLDALEGRGVRLPVLPRARPGAGRPAAGLDRRGGRVAPVPAGRPAGGGGGRLGTGRRPPTRSSRWSASASTPTSSGVVAAGGDAGPGGASPRQRGGRRHRLGRPPRRCRRSLRLVAMEADGSLTTAQARTVLKELLESGGDPESMAARLGFEAMAAGDLAAVVDQVIAEHPSEWDRYLAGEDKLTGFFIGQIKAATLARPTSKPPRCSYGPGGYSGRPCSSASPIGPAGSWSWPKKRLDCSVTTSSAPSTFCSA